MRFVKMRTHVRQQEEKPKRGRRNHGHMTKWGRSVASVEGKKGVRDYGPSGGA